MPAPIFSKIAAIDIAEAVSERIGSFVFVDFIQFLSVEEDTVRCWYINSGGEGPSYEINLGRAHGGWALELIEHPPGTEPVIEYVLQPARQ
jgi:hypothetical protein